MVIVHGRVVHMSVAGAARTLHCWHSLVCMYGREDLLLRSGKQAAGTLQALVA
jgi:hypothetical protein